jgi:hypothetical protein
MTPTEDYRRFPLHAGGSAMVRATPEAVWAVVQTIGGENRYFALNGLWTLREQLDALVGGIGAEHVRPEGSALRLGDRIDSWTVIGLDPPRLLALRFGMRAPGRGVLEFVIEPVGGGSRLTACAWWDPDGIAGRLYWIAMKPPHLVLFDRLTAEIGRRAEAGERRGRPAARTA